VRKLAEAGIVSLGKLATHEFAFGGPSFDLPWPPARNPWNPEHFPAGSSSGTGAAVATGMVLGGTGSDTGGSIRGPAALCGIAGIKPTYGLCSRAGVLPLAQSLDHTGPMAWTVEDCALLLQAMAGHDPADPASADRPVPDFTARLGQGVKGLRIGVIRHFHETDCPVSAATLKGIEDAAAFFRAEGAELRDVALPPLADFNACGWVILMAEAFAVHEAWMKRDPSLYGELLRHRLVLGGLLSAADVMAAQKKRRELVARTEAAAQGVDLLLTAAQPAEAPRIDAVPKWGFLEKPNFTVPFNVTGWPGLTVCTGFGEGGLPVAMQLVAKPFEEPLLFQAGHAYEKAMPWRNWRPALLAGVPAG
jgi:aspartyl-tRNA(Asn)/glutamyl-tRNA(Gln) amidotransferase subunit A